MNSQQLKKWVLWVLILSSWPLSAQTRWVERGWHQEAPASLNGVAFGANTFIAVGEDDKARGVILLSSSDATEWTEIAAPTNILTSVAYGGGRFVAGTSDGSVFYSDNGTKWQRQTTGLSSAITRVQRIGEFFVATSADKAPAVSRNGLDWHVTESPLVGKVLGVIQRHNQAMMLVVAAPVAPCENINISELTSAFVLNPALAWEAAGFVKPFSEGVTLHENGLNVIFNSFVVSVLIDSDIGCISIGEPQSVGSIGIYVENENGKWSREECVVSGDEFRHHTPIISDTAYGDGYLLAAGEIIVARTGPNRWREVHRFNANSIDFGNGVFVAVGQGIVTSKSQPELANITHTGDRVYVTILGPSGANVGIETSTDLIFWEPWKRFDIKSSPQDVPVEDYATVKSRFFRLMSAAE